MKTIPMLLAAAALLATAGCDRAEKADDGSSVVINEVAEGDGGDGRMELKLPGGFEAKINVPGGMSDMTKFDIDGVGLYPGAKVRSIKVNAQGKDSEQAATVEMGFRAPADAAAVADWYQNQFEAKKIAVSRSGETLTGKTDGGDDFTLALAARGEGGSQGTLTIRDVKKG
ncbi:hypothetical protein [Sandarakinorhabdus sp. DWP1-3-1]|uniref:hypothetical protein n=1 Tax=Sandarakinorhabdus sp. DWP1-3-1 TaxID=2804627 RepID=UPI003CF35512